MRVETLGGADGERDPDVAVVGGIHGDEPCGVAAVEDLLESRPAVARPVKLVVANEEAVARGTRYVDTDLNRAFPGDPDGQSLEHRLAYRLGEEVGDCVTLALHSTQSYEGMFALVDKVDDLAREICPQLSVDALVETGAPEGRVFESVPDTIEVECGYQGSDAARALSTVVLATPPGYVLGWLVARGLGRSGGFPVWLTLVAVQAVAVTVDARRSAA